MNNQWKFEPGPFGPRMMMTGPWTDGAFRELRLRHVKSLYLNTAKGWRCTDYSFLRDIPELEDLEILDYTARDVSAVNYLVNLRRLTVFTYCKSELRLVDFHQLRECSIEWRSRAGSVFELRSLNQLLINRLPDKDLSRFSNMGKLSSLTLLSPSIRSLAGIDALWGLRYLRIGEARSLTTLEGIQSLAHLRRLELDGSRKFCDITPIGFLRQLEFLSLSADGDLETLRSLEALSRLEEFYFTESTTVLDGDLSVLTRLANLKKLAFQDRDHYSHRRSDFPCLHGVISQRK